MSGKIRLVKVITQSVFVIDDGRQLTEVVGEPVEVSAAEWPSYPTGRFAESLQILQQELDNSENK